MTYMPIKTSGRLRVGNVMGTMPIYGTNLQDDSQLLDTRFALFIENYLVHGVAKMQKRPGQQVNFDTTESNEIPLSEEFRYDDDIIAYGAKVRAYNNVTGLFTNIKTDFVGSDFTGGRYGDYFFVNTLLDGLWRIDYRIAWAESYNLVGNNTFMIAKQIATTITAGQTLTDSTTGHTGTVVSVTAESDGAMTLVVNSLTGVFTLGGAVTGGTLAAASLTNVNPMTTGLKITGATTGTTAIILEQSDGGATGYFVLGSILGAGFANGEILTDTSTGRVLTTSLVTFGITQVSGAPKAKIFRIVGKRGLLVNLATDESAYNYSAADTGTSPPFTNWTTGTGFNDPGAGSNRNGGACRDACMIGDIIFVGQQSGWYAFQITQTEISGVSAKYDQEVSTRQNFPVYRCVMTNVGMIVTNSSGIWRLISLGQPNIPYSDQWESLTEELGEDYFTDVTFDKTDTMYDPLRGFIYVTMDKDSDTNNLVLAVKAELTGVDNAVKTGATSFLTGWNVLRFMVRGNTIYGTSAIDGIRHILFIGQKDVERPIHSEYLQELNFALTDAFNMEEFFTKGEFSGASLVTISFDTFDETGYYEARRRVYTWLPRHSYVADEGGWGSAAFGSGAWGGASIVGGLVPVRRGAKIRLRELSRVFLRFESDDYSEHVINWFSANAVITKQTRDRSLDEVTS